MCSVRAVLWHCCTHYWWWQWLCRSSSTHGKTVDKVAFEVSVLFNLVHVTVRVHDLAARVPYQMVEI